MPLSSKTNSMTCSQAKTGAYEMHNIDINQAKQNFTALIEKTVSNGEVIITKDGQPVVKMVPLIKTKKKRKFGTAKDLIKMSDDFDQPIDDFKEYM
jgi:prevent-host-death family protein